MSLKYWRERKCIFKCKSFVINLVMELGRNAETSFSIYYRYVVVHIKSIQFIKREISNTGKDYGIAPSSIPLRIRTHGEKNKIPSNLNMGKSTRNEPMMTVFYWTTWIIQKNCSNYTSESASNKTVITLNLFIVYIPTNFQRFIDIMIS